ncbi:hypothetical protein ACFVDI_05445 [Nocardioides sp. NPDC057767]|uniref:Steroid delta-isomerase-like uncharacterized protein n=1 Tax=Nocardioides panzhihuensis TaxID=860243 RepID=A0A7Z0DMV8_9ACTN|nr:hypothetical protein [Nocardioides panzhihuensis]NYI78268.1 steroid delta-isomerase-like uncharacterized protein [Nocardioides panzhihuensis]
MNYAFAIKWLKAFRESSEVITALYADDFVFEDPILDQFGITDKGDLGRIFDLYANKDRTNGLGVHNFRIRGYWGDHKSGLIRWEWGPEDCTNFIGLDVANKPFVCQGHTFHQYNDDGLIVRESSWWEISTILEQIGYPGADNPRPLGKTAVPA